MKMLKKNHHPEELPVVDKIVYKGWLTWTGSGRPARPLAQYEVASKGDGLPRHFHRYLEAREHRLGQKPARWGRGRSTAARRRRVKRGRVA